MVNKFLFIHYEWSFLAKAYPLMIDCNTLTLGNTFEIDLIINNDNSNFEFYVSKIPEQIHPLIFCCLPRN